MAGLVVACGLLNSIFGQGEDLGADIGRGLFFYFLVVVAVVLGNRDGNLDCRLALVEETLTLNAGRHKTTQSWVTTEFHLSSLPRRLPRRQRNSLIHCLGNS